MVSAHGSRNQHPWSVRVTRRAEIRQSVTNMYACGRRDFIFVLGGVALSVRSVARAQEPGRTYRIAMVSNFPRGNFWTATILDELRRQGFVEGVNLLNVGAQDVPFSKTEAAVTEALKAGPDVIIAGGGWGTRIWQSATRTIPIVTFSTISSEKTS